MSTIFTGITSHPPHCHPCYHHRHHQYHGASSTITDDNNRNFACIILEAFFPYLHKNSENFYCCMYTLVPLRFLHCICNTSSILTWGSLRSPPIPIWTYPYIPIIYQYLKRTV